MLQSKSTQWGSVLMCLTGGQPIIISSSNTNTIRHHHHSRTPRYWSYVYARSTMVLDAFGRAAIRIARKCVNHFAHGKSYINIYVRCIYLWDTQHSRLYNTCYITLCMRCRARAPRGFVSVHKWYSIYAMGDIEVFGTNCRFDSFSRECIVHLF